jgi:hypothetical protein
MSRGRSPRARACGATTATRLTTYGLIWVDADGAPLDGTNRYELRLATPPPVDAFWSLTMYDVPDFYLVANPIDRYSIGDRTPGLKTAEDGSITIYLQKDSPGPERESNWLPTPAGAFRPILRMYRPRREILDGTYILPAITRADPAGPANEFHNEQRGSR